MGRFFKKAKIMNRLFQYFRDTKGELKHVSWPTQKQTMVFTSLVILISFATAFYIGALDSLFTRALDFILK